MDRHMVLSFYLLLLTLLLFKKKKKTDVIYSLTSPAAPAFKLVYKDKTNKEC